jgi:hypothetical protein
MSIAKRNDIKVITVLRAYKAAHDRLPSYNELIKSTSLTRFAIHDSLNRLVDKKFLIALSNGSIPYALKKEIENENI